MSENTLSLNSAIEDFLVGKNRDENFHHIYTELHPKIFKFLYGKLNDYDSAGELTQMTFIRVSNSIADARLEYANSFLAWVFAIARNIYIDELRRNKRRKEVALSVENDEKNGKVKVFDPPDTRAAANIEETIIKKEHQKKILEAMEKLPPMQQECLSLHIYQEKTASEIAILLKKNRETVKAHIKQAKDNLKKILSDEK